MSRKEGFHILEFEGQDCYSSSGELEVCTSLQEVLS